MSPRDSRLGFLGGTAAALLFSLNATAVPVRENRAGVNDVDGDPVGADLCRDVFAEGGQGGVTDAGAGCADLARGCPANADDSAVSG